jgi:hypothetical protein
VINVQQLNFDRLSSAIRSQINPTRRYVAELVALDLVAAPPKEVCRLLTEATSQKVTPNDLRDWQQGMPIPKRVRLVLRRIAEFGVIAATEELINAAKDDHRVCYTVGWRRFSQRIREARELLRLTKDAPIQ